MRISDWSSDVCSSDLRLENRFDRFAEQARQAERQRQARVVLSGFDRVDGLARNVQALGQLALRPAEAFAQLADATVHGGYWNLRATTIRSEERSVGKECCSKCRSRGLPKQ